MTSSESVRFVKSCRVVESYWCQPRCILCPTLQIGPAKGGKRIRKRIIRGLKEKGRKGKALQRNQNTNMTWHDWVVTLGLWPPFWCPKKQRPKQCLSAPTVCGLQCNLSTKEYQRSARQHGTSILWTKLRDTVNHMSCKQTTCWNLRLTTGKI